MEPPACATRSYTARLKAGRTTTTARSTQPAATAATHGTSKPRYGYSNASAPRPGASSFTATNAPEPCAPCTSWPTCPAFALEQIRHQRSVGKRRGDLVDQKFRFPAERVVNTRARNSQIQIHQALGQPATLTHSLPPKSVFCGKTITGRDGSAPPARPARHLPASQSRAYPQGLRPHTPEPSHRNRSQCAGHQRQKCAPAARTGVYANPAAKRHRNHD